VSGYDTEPEDDEAPAPERRRRGAKLSPEQQARVDAEAVVLGRFLPLGMVAGAVVGVIAGALTHRWGICIPVGVAVGILVAGTLPLMRRK
jgi:hypothetical protein